MQPMFVIYWLLDCYPEGKSDIFTAYTPWSLYDGYGFWLDKPGLTDCVWMIPNTGLEN